MAVPLRINLSIIDQFPFQLMNISSSTHQGERSFINNDEQLIIYLREKR